MNSVAEANLWCLIDWAFLRPYHVADDQDRFLSLLDRARSLVPEERIVLALREQDRPWWAIALSEHPRGNIIEQPFDRGSAPAVLVGALVISERDPAAEVLLLGRSNGRWSVSALLNHYRRRAPELTRSLRAAAIPGSGGPELDHVYPFLECLELDRIVGP